MSPLILGAAAVGAYFLLFKKGMTRTIVENGPTSDVRDPNTGTVFTSKLDEVFSDGTKKVDVFIKSTGTRVVKFMQTGSDTGSRVSLGSPPGTDPTILAAAMRVFGIRPKATA